MTHKKVAFYTLGCKLNFSESSALSKMLGEDNYKLVEFEDSADVYIINTCSVTENADKKCRAIIRKGLNTAPEAKIVIIGCYAQLKPQEIVEIPGVSLVLGAAEKFRLVEYLNTLWEQEEPIAEVSEICAADTFYSSYSSGERTRAFLKVQDGCDYNCSFCTIPLARGRSRSDSIENVLAKAEEIAAKGIREIVLTGINLGDYGKGIRGGRKSDVAFLDLIEALDQVEGIDRYRISSIEPNLLSEEIIAFVAQSKKFCPHFHIPLQSGSDNILSAMRRRYKRALYVEKVNRIKELMPDCAIGVDVIVGFPGETEEEFLTTYNFLNELPVSYLHVFAYSERDNTLAIELDGVVSIEERKRRSKMLRNLSHKKKNAFYRQHLNQEAEVLFETEKKDGLLYGFTENYIKVAMDFDQSLVNQIVPVQLNSLSPDNIMQVKPLGVVHS